MADDVPSGSEIAAQGWCPECDCEHVLPVGGAGRLAVELMAEFESLGRLDYTVEEEDADPGLAFAELFPGERGHMFGVLECEDGNGDPVVLRAFSSLHGGVRTIGGWVPPVLKDEVFDPLYRPAEKEIKRLTREMLELEPGSDSHRKLTAQRKQISSELMPRIHDHYELTNFREETRSLRDAFFGQGGLPGGTGDCCAPKLLNHAALNGLRPKGLAEFYWGGPHRTGNRQAGRFYAACAEKCQPIMGFMLCGSGS